MNFKQSIATAVTATLLTSPASAQTGKLEREVSRTARQIYDDLHGNSNHSHMVYNPNAKIPYIVDVGLPACSEGHGTCPEFTTSVVYDPRKDRSYLIETFGREGKIDIVEIGIVKGKLPKDFLSYGSANSFETKACGQSAEFSLRDLGVNPNQTLGYIKDRSGVLKGTPLVSMQLGSINPKAYSEEQFCALGDEQSKRVLYQDSMENLRSLPQMYSAYRNSFQRKAPRVKQPKR